MLFIFLLTLIGLPWHILGSGFYKAMKFVDGNVTFSWNPPSKDVPFYDVKITKNQNSEGWKQTKDTQFTLTNVILYDHVKILVRTGGFKEAVNNYLEFTVRKTKAPKSKTVNISWTIEQFPVAGQYQIYQTYKKNIPLFVITKDKVSYGENISEAKHTYLSKPYNSTNIMFTIRDLTIDDAGYYNGGTSAEVALSGGGVVLIVTDIPSKPTIPGTFDVEVNKNITLTCLSKSTSAPDYYSKLVTLSYTWFVNDTKITGETRYTLELYVTRKHKYKGYSCTATEDDLVSDTSDTVQINPLYGPEEIMFESPPNIQNNRMINIKENETVGPFSCIVHCNPTCETTWTSIFSNGSASIVSGEIKLQKQHMKRDIVSFHCKVKWRSELIMEKGINLSVLYLDKPALYKNNSRNSEPMWTVKENEPLRVACFVDGNPTPTVRLIKGHNEISNNTNTSKWANYTAKRCEDTDNYTCEGSSKGFNSNNRTVKINIICKLRIDKSGPLQTNYISTSGNNVKVALAIPVIANPPPQASDITLMGPNDQQIISNVSQRDVVYKHWINTSVPMNNHSNFGYYVIKYKNEIIHNITINAQDRPQQPFNFMAYSYASGYVNMTWTSGFNGGSEQFFLIWMSDGTGWKMFANLTDPGKGVTAHFNHGPLTPGQEIVYRLESCNIINCSIQSVEINVKVKEISKASLTEEGEVFYAVIVVPTGVFILIVSLAVVLVIFFRRKTKNKSITNNEITQEGAEMYAVVDKSKTSNNGLKDKAGTSGATKDNYGSYRKSTGEMYEAVDKSLLKENKLKATILTKENTNKKDASQHGAETYAVVDKTILKKGKECKTTTKLVKTKKSKEKNKGKNGSLEEKNVSPVGSRRTNDEGLIYIDVDFTNKPGSSDTNQKPLIHGEEDRTEYTFVDFSKKVTPMQETRDDEGK